MQSLHPTPELPTRPQLRRLPHLSPQNHAWVAAYLAHLRARHYALSTQDNALRALKCFAVLLPEARQTTLYQDLTQTTPADIDTWIAAAFQQGLAPGTILPCRRGMHGFFVFLCDQAVMAQSPIQLPRHQILVPTRLPRPMAEAEGVAFFRVIDALEDRTIFLLMLRCGLRGSEVSRLRWAAIDMAHGTLRVNNGKGQVDRVVSLSPDVATALRQWSGLRAATAGYVFPSCWRVPAAPARLRSPSTLGATTRPCVTPCAPSESEGLGCLTAKSSAPKRVQAIWSKARDDELRELLHQSPRVFGKSRSTWTLQLIAQVCFERGMTSRELSDEAIRLYAGATGHHLEASQALDDQPRPALRAEEGPPGPSDSPVGPSPGVGTGLRG